MKQELDKRQHDLSVIRQELQDVECRLVHVRESLGVHWVELDADDITRETSAPWLTHAWRKAREELFLAALAVHQAFIEHHASVMLSNLGLANHWLQGKEMPHYLVRLALDALCLVVPVISTTFAAIPRMFRGMGREGIAWLLIDEAGQGLPQQAAGAIWRAKRSLVVGDPNHLEPVMTVPAVLEGAFARYYDVHASWWPGSTSIQRLADQAMDIGTWLPDTEAGKLWVGCPLRVHRRCDQPMFSISNTIAYDDLMVFGTPSQESFFPESCWIHVSSEEGQGHWIIQEGVIARRLVQILKAQYDLEESNLFLISPFKSVAIELHTLARQLFLDPQKAGTVHTTQGKEAHIVLLVLGGDPKKPGAKNWAAKKPNLLNVAVSRAKKRLYVIGDLEKWRKQPFFRVMAEALPSYDSVEDVLVNCEKEQFGI